VLRCILRLLPSRESLFCPHAVVQILPFCANSTIWRAAVNVVLSTSPRPSSNPSSSTSAIVWTAGINRLLPLGSLRSFPCLIFPNQLNNTLANGSTQTTQGRRKNATSATNVARGFCTSIQGGSMLPSKGGVWTIWTQRCSRMPLTFGRTERLYPFRKEWNNTGGTRFRICVVLGTGMVS